MITPCPQLQHVCCAVSDCKSESDQQWVSYNTYYRAPHGRVVVGAHHASQCPQATTAGPCCSCMLLGLLCSSARKPGHCWDSVVRTFAASTFRALAGSIMRLGAAGRGAHVAGRAWRAMRLGCRRTIATRSSSKDLELVREEVAPVRSSKTLFRHLVTGTSHPCQHRIS